jgi:hypothetical protein
MSKLLILPMFIFQNREIMQTMNAVLSRGFKQPIIETRPLQRKSVGPHLTLERAVSFSLARRGAGFLTRPQGSRQRATNFMLVVSG